MRLNFTIYLEKWNELVADVNLIEENDTFDYLATISFFLFVNFNPLILIQRNEVCIIGGWLNDFSKEI